MAERSLMVVPLLVLAFAPAPAVAAQGRTASPEISASASAAFAPASIAAVGTMLTPALAAPAPPPPSDPVVLHGLQELGRLARGPDGALLGSEALGGKPRVRPEMPGVAVKPADGNLSELQAHEVATIRKIRAWAADLQLIIPESGPTPDLLVDGVPTELKRVHGGSMSRQLMHANEQLLSHASRHGLGLGAVVLDVHGEPLSSAEVEAGIAEVRRARPRIGFARVYVFNGDEAAVYSPGSDGTFRLDAAARPFGPPNRTEAP